MRTSVFLFTKAQFSWNHVPKRFYANNAPRNVYVTTPIFYINNVPHIGHLYTACLADVIARYESMHGQSVFLCTGTDEHGSKVEKAAKALKLPLPEYCSQISQKFREMCNTFDIDYSRFIRTTDEDHRKAVHHFWVADFNQLEGKGHIYAGTYSGWYCASDEAFLSDSELIEKKNAAGETVKVSAESGNPVEWTNEDTYKFRLSAFQDDLKYWLKDENVVRPTVYHKMLSSWVEEGTCLRDLSISRPSQRVPWAIPTPRDNSQSIYVWMDALVNYLTALGYPDDSYKKFWPPAVQVLGKDILKFHGVYWPAFLIAAGLEPPKTLFCHGHWIINDEKMSKSKGNVVSPFEAAESFTTNGLRYFLVRHAVADSNANYNVDKIRNVLNSELADTFGNLVSRCFGESINPEREIPNLREYVHVLKSNEAIMNIKLLESLNESAKKYYEQYEFYHLMDAVMSTLFAANQMFNHHKPWVLAKDVDNTKASEERKAVLALALETARVASLVMYPLVPRLVTELLNFLQVPQENRTWNDTVPLHATNCSISTRPIETRKAIIFKRIMKG